MNSPPQWDPLPDLVPVRMLNEFTYCPRLAYLEWVQGEFQENADTADGKFRHRAVDQPSQADKPGPEDSTADQIVDSVNLSAPLLGLVTIIDRLEITGLQAIPVDFKHSAAPPDYIGAWDADQIQLCAQGLILEENGYTSPHGIAYYTGSRQRIQIPFDAALRDKTRQTLAGLRQTAETGRIPEPLRDSPKCPGCSLAGICLPDETQYLRLAAPEDDPDEQLRMILPSADDRLPLYVQEQGARVSKTGDVLQVLAGSAVQQQFPLHELSSVSLFGGVHITTPALQTLCSRGVPVCYFSMGGWFYGMTTGLIHKNIELRQAQFRGADSPDKSLPIARRLIADKIRNCRTLLRRNAKDLPPEALAELGALVKRAEEAAGAESLLGIEGAAARVYFQNFTRMLKRPAGEEGEGFDMEGRNRRPPRDPVNAMLSFCYALLTKTWTVTLLAMGFDPHLGFYHRPRYGRPALALDMMEPFRPLVADSAVIGVINGGSVRPEQFIRRIGAVTMNEAARKALIEAFERRLMQEITHPVFKYQINYRQVLEVQARLLGRFLTGEIKAPPEFVTR